VWSNFFSVPRTTMPSRGWRCPIRCTVATPAGTKPIARKVERRTVAVLQPKHVAMEVLGAFQIGGLDGVMLQGAE
jgi:hypothetical protein